MPTESAVKPPIEVGSKYICVKIHNGKTTVEAFGYNGVGCREATASIEQTLGGVSSRKDKKTPGPKQTVKMK
jgi:hypothetical protein